MSRDNPASFDHESSAANSDDLRSPFGNHDSIWLTSHDVDRHPAEIIRHECLHLSEGFALLATPASIAVSNA